MAQDGFFLLNILPKILSSGKLQFNLFNNDDKVYVRQLINQRYNVKYTILTAKFDSD